MFKNRIINENVVNFGQKDGLNMRFYLKDYFFSVNGIGFENDDFFQSFCSKGHFSFGSIKYTAEKDVKELVLSMKPISDSLIFKISPFTNSIQANWSHSYEKVFESKPARLSFLSRFKIGFEKYLFESFGNINAQSYNFQYRFRSNSSPHSRCTSLELISGIHLNFFNSCAYFFPFTKEFGITCSAEFHGFPLVFGFNHKLDQLDWRIGSMIKTEKSSTKFFMKNLSQISAKTRLELFNIADIVIHFNNSIFENDKMKMGCSISFKL